MTTTTDPHGWPDASKPGYPANPERDGWHWLKHPEDLRPFPSAWNAELGGWPSGALHSPRGVVDLGFTYIGPCLTPAEVAAAVQAEREACLTIVGNVYPVTNGATSEWRKARDAIRARGDTSALAEAVEAARREEREACAALCERDAALLRQDLDFDTARGVAHAAAAIRARSGGKEGA